MKKIIRFLLFLPDPRTIELQIEIRILDELIHSFKK